MTNEEAFKSWFDNQIWGNESWEDGLRESWQAAIAYMQERDKLVEHCCPECGCHFVGEFPFNYKVKQNKSAEQSEPVATIYNGIAYWIGKEPPEGTNLFATPQRQQPLKRLSQLDVLKILNEYAKSPYTNTQSSLGFANAIMDEMERINK